MADEPHGNYAFEPIQYTSSVQTEDFPDYTLPRSNPYAHDNNSVGQMVAAAWSLYRGQPEEGEWRYSFGRTEDKKGYEVNVRLHF